MDVELEDDADSLFYAAAGPLAAIVLGIVLMSLRGFTVASNFAFAFLALTLAIADLGGRRAALATAVSSALSLNFFLTQPYLRLTIHGKDDLIGFVGLAACGLLAASLGPHGGRSAAFAAARRHRDLLRTVLSDWDATAPIEPQLSRALLACRRALPVAAAAIRDARGYLVASSSPADGLRPVPDPVLRREMLLRADGGVAGTPRAGAALPETGARIPLVAGDCPLGWLDVWGNGGKATLESRRALADVAALVSVLLAGIGAGPGRRA
jgi:hypothetical protein